MAHHRASDAQRGTRFVERGTRLASVRLFVRHAISTRFLRVIPLGKDRPDALHRRRAGSPCAVVWPRVDRDAVHQGASKGMTA
jgi:hypothetical protein